MRSMITLLLVLLLSPAYAAPDTLARIVETGEFRIGFNIFRVLNF